MTGRHSNRQTDSNPLTILFLLLHGIHFLFLQVLLISNFSTFSLKTCSSLREISPTSLIFLCRFFSGLLLKQLTYYCEADMALNSSGGAPGSDSSVRVRTFKVMLPPATTFFPIRLWLKCLSWQVDAWNCMSFQDWRPFLEEDSTSTGEVSWKIVWLEMFATNLHCSSIKLIKPPRNTNPRSTDTFRLRKRW